MKLSFLLIPAIALILGCFFYFSVACKTGFYMLFAAHRICPVTVMLRFFTALVKKALNTSEILLLSEITSFSLTNVTFTGSLHLSKSNGFTVFQKVLLSLIFLVSRFSK